MIMVTQGVSQFEEELSGTIDHKTTDPLLETILVDDHTE